MALTQEEIDKIHAEEVERAKAKAKIEEEERRRKYLKKKSKQRTNLIIFFALCFVLYLIYSLLASSEPAQRVREAQQKAAQEALVQQQAAQDKAREEIGKVEIVSYSIAPNSIGTPNLTVKIKNNSDRTIDAITFGAYFLNNFNEPVGKFSTNSREAFGGIFQETIDAGKSTSGTWNLAVYDNATRVESINIKSIHYVDGETYSVSE